MNFSEHGYSHKQQFGVMRSLSWGWMWYAKVHVCCMATTANLTEIRKTDITIRNTEIE